MKTSRLFLKGESTSDTTELNFSNMINSRIESGVPVHIPISIVKNTEQAAAVLGNPVISKLVGVKRVVQDTGASKPKVVIEVEVNSYDYIRVMKAIGNGYSLAGNGYSLYGYCVELWMKVSSLSQNDVYYIEHRQSVSAQTTSPTKDSIAEKQRKTEGNDMKSKTTIKIPYGVGEKSYKALNNAIRLIPADNVLVLKHKKETEVVGEISDYYLDHKTGLVYLDVDFKKETLEKAVALFPEDKVNPNSNYYIFPVKKKEKRLKETAIEMLPFAVCDSLASAQDAVNFIRKEKIFKNEYFTLRENHEVRGKCLDVFINQSQEGVLSLFTVMIAIEFNKDIADKHRELIDSKKDISKPKVVLEANTKSLDDHLEYQMYKSLERDTIGNKTKKEIIETIINSFSHIENNDSAFNLKKHILSTLRADDNLSSITKLSLDRAIVRLQYSNIQEDIPKKIELKVGVPIMSLKHHTLISNNKKENFLAIIEIMDASFKCPIIDLSVCKNIDGSIDKIMVTVSVSAKARKAIEMYGLSLKDKAGVVIGRIIERNTGNYVSHISIPSQEDSLYYKRHKSLKDFDGDTFYKLPENNLQNHVLPEDLNPENKTFKYVSEITDEYLSRLLNVSISRGIAKSGSQSIIATIPAAKFSKREYLDLFVQKYRFRHKTSRMFSSESEIEISYRNNKDFKLYIIEDEEGYPKLDIEQENNIFTAYLKVYIPISLIIKLGAKTFKELYNKVTDDCELDVDFNVEVKSNEPVVAQAKDPEIEYESILYPEVKFERFKDAKKYVDAINREIEAVENALKSNHNISNLPMLTNNNFKDFKAYIEKATIGIYDYKGFGSKAGYSAVLCILVPNEVVEKLKEDNISLKDIIEHTLENIEICKKGKFKNITMATPTRVSTGVYLNRIDQYLRHSNSIWRQKDGGVAKTYRILYTYIKNAKIKALAIEIE